MIGRHRQRMINKLVVLAIVGLLAILALGGRESLNEYSRLRQIYRELLNDTVELVNKNKRLGTDKKNLYSPPYLEKLSRESLGLVKPGEVIYVVEDQ